MILSRYIYNGTVIERQPPLPTITECYGPFPILTKRYQALNALPSVTERYIFYLIKNFKWTVLKLIYFLSVKLFLFSS